MSLFENYILEPIENFVVLQREESKETTSGGLYLPQTSQSKSYQAKVLAVGPGRPGPNGERIKPQVSVGDTVVVDKIGGFELEIENEKFLIVREPEIVTIIRRK